MRKLVVTSEGGRFVEMTPDEISELNSQQAKWVSEKGAEPVSIESRLADIEKRLDNIEKARKA